MTLLNRRKAGNNGLEEARESLADTNGRILELSRRREGLLLTDNDSAVETLDLEIAGLQRAAKRHSDRIHLLELEEQREEAGRVAKRNRELIERVEGKLANRDRVGAELQATVEKAARLFREIVSLTEEASAGWPFDMHLAASLSAPAIQRAVAHELFRVGHCGFVGGGSGQIVQPSFPGGKSPDYLVLPEQVKPLGDVLREISEHATAFMHGTTVTPAADPPSDSAARTREDALIGD